jgi:hypothetical protein
MTTYERLGVLAIVISTGAVCAVGTVYLRHTAAPTPVAQQMRAAPQPLVPAPVRTVAWFKAHRAEMKAKYAACMNDPGLGQFDPECQNVFAAKQSADLDDTAARYGVAGKK